MKSKPLVRRRSARRDTEDASDYYLREAGPSVALAFLDAMERVLRSIRARLGLGSPGFGHRLGVEGLRSRRVERFPFLIFYMEQEQQIEVWRVLHAQRDIVSEFSEGEQ